MPPSSNASAPESHDRFPRSSDLVSWARTVLSVTVRSSPVKEERNHSAARSTGTTTGSWARTCFARMRNCWSCPGALRIREENRDLRETRARFAAEGFWFRIALRSHNCRVLITLTSWMSELSHRLNTRRHVNKRMFMTAGAYSWMNKHLPWFTHCSSSKRITPSALACEQTTEWRCRETRLYSHILTTCTYHCQIFICIY